MSNLAHWQVVLLSEDAEGTICGPRGPLGAYMWPLI